jgi:hypothetical protein
MEWRGTPALPEIHKKAWPYSRQRVNAGIAVLVFGASAGKRLVPELQKRVYKRVGQNCRNECINASAISAKARFLEAIEKRITAAEHGEFIEEEELDVRLESMFRP